MILRKHKAESVINLSAFSGMFVLHWLCLVILIFSQVSVQRNCSNLLEYTNKK